MRAKRTMALIMVAVGMSGCGWKKIGWEWHGGTGGGFAGKAPTAPSPAPDRRGAPGLRAAKAPAVFTHGVASGEAGSTSVLLWTRTAEEARLRVQVSADPDFPKGETVERGVATKSARDFTAAVRVTRLDPATAYWYRFVDPKGETASEIGRFRTAPLPSVAADLRFVFTGDTDGTRIDGAPAFNDFQVLDRAREEDPDFFLYLGDTIYTDSPMGLLNGVPAAETLDDYRAKYRENRGYAALRGLLGATSTLAVWDDHEVVDNFAGTTADPDRLAAGRQAFEEYMPVARHSRKTGYFRHFRWGTDAEFFVLDERSFRSANASVIAGNDPLPTLPAEIRTAVGLGLAADPPAGTLEALADPARTMLGARQKEIFKSLLLASDARFKFVVNEVAVAELFADPYDRWEGYRAERDEILQFVVDNRIANVVFLTGDMHTNAVLDVRVSVLQGSEVVAKEIIAGPAAEFTLSQEIDLLYGEGASAAFIGLIEGLNPPVFADHDAYGYALVEVDSGAGTATVTLKDAAGAVLYAITLP